VNESGIRFDLKVTPLEDEFGVEAVFEFPGHLIANVGYRLLLANGLLPSGVTVLFPESHYRPGNDRTLVVSATVPNYELGTFVQAAKDWYSWLCRELLPWQPVFDLLEGRQG